MTLIILQILNKRLCWWGLLEPLRLAPKLSFQVSMKHYDDSMKKAPRLSRRWRSSYKMPCLIHHFPLLQKIMKHNELLLENHLDTLQESFQQEQAPAAPLLETCQGRELGVKEPPRSTREARRNHSLKISQGCLARQRKIHKKYRKYNDNRSQNITKASVLERTKGCLQCS